ncbi:large subunit ribosomal protein L25 [Verrucomicrobium sp. GAS474]|uniref:50S ribosomal protein L25 n=1 Tax=Verrucomicrobium sp. GAS474 TaxID=1882831 RepID=UPI00087D1C2D|nr:50S ribosomal protein L25 [Verrucomicrobium sp. GAS474]SDU10102.1 large subunit ribosomal protein L25 [Verrucomicrobium sp. GAS474]
MAKTISLKASTRTQLGRNAIKSLRKSGVIPGVIYGKKGTHPVSIDKKELKEALHGVSSENVLVDLQFASEGKTEAKFVFLQEVQHDFLLNVITHVDLHEIAADEELHVDVPVLEVGEAPGVTVAGGLLDTVLRRLHVACLPKNLPENIVVDVSKLEVGQAIHVGDIELPAGVRVLNPKDQIIVVVHAPKTEEEAKAAEGTADAAKEPEVIKEKKVDPAAAAADPKAKDAKKK